jgi:hypothetical protein
MSSSCSKTLINRIKQEQVFLPTLTSLVGEDRSDLNFALFQAIDIGKSILVVCCCDIGLPQFSSLIASVPPIATYQSSSLSISTPVSSCSALIDEGLSNIDEAESISRAINALFKDKIILLSWNVPETMPDLAREVIKKALIQWLMKTI